MRSLLRLACVVSFFVVPFVSGASAQTPLNDDCSTPVSLAGPGPWTYSNASATTGAPGPVPTPCSNYIGKDLWFTWTAPSSGYFSAVTVGLTSVDTKIAVYTGAGCPATAAIACGDDYGSYVYQSLVEFPATALTSYTIQLGLSTFSNTGGPGEFAIIPVAPPANDSCAAAGSWSGPGYFTFDNTYATTSSEGQSSSACNVPGNGTAVTQDVWYVWTPNQSGTATLSTCGTTTVNTKIAAYDGAGCPSGSALACSDNFCGVDGNQSEISFAVTCGHDYTVQIGARGLWPGDLQGGVGHILATVAGQPCLPPTAFCFGDGSGTACPCGNTGAPGHGCANSQFGTGTVLTAAGRASATAGDSLTLTASGMGGPGLFFQGDGQFVGGAGVTFGDGLLCAGGVITRMAVVFPAAGSASYPSVSAPTPIHIAGGTAPGDVRHYQCWYRDAASFCTTATFNLTHGLTVTWNP